MADEEEAAKVREVSNKKAGIELFRELLRHYPHAEIEDYYKAGQWRNELLKADLLLVEAHRREAGAPEPILLEQVPPPKLPAPGFMSPFVVPKGVGAIAGAGASATVAAGAQMMSSGLAELRAMALFVAKWKLDPMRTKQMLAKLTPERRRQVLQGFSTDAAAGPEANTDALDQYIKKLEEANPTQDATSGTVMGGLSKAPPSAAAMAVTAGIGLSKASSMAAAAAEMRLIALFVAKFKLDAARTKALLSSVPPTRRTHVVQSFTTNLEGPEATDALEQFIKEYTAGNGGDLQGMVGAEVGNKRPLSIAGSPENGDIKRLMVSSSVPAAP